MEVSLDEALEVLGEPIEEKSAWAILVLGYKALQLWAGKLVFVESSYALKDCFNYWRYPW